MNKCHEKKNNSNEFILLTISDCVSIGIVIINGHEFLELNLGTMILNGNSKFFLRVVAVLLKIHGPLLVYGQRGQLRGSWLYLISYSQIRTKKDKAQLEKQKLSGRINAMEQANKLVDDAVLLHLLP